MGLFSQNMYEPNGQAKAVYAYLNDYGGVEASWDQQFGYRAVHVSPWLNGRERGYVVSFSNKYSRQLNIAFFEHRNSDDICAIKWVQSTINQPTIETADFGGGYKDKYDVSHSVSRGRAAEMADWIMEQLNAHWGAAE